MDTFDRETCPKKLQYYGFRGKSLNWSHSFLSKKSQYVEINQQRSSSSDVNLGVPQGSTLDPLMQSLHIYDLTKSLTVLKSIHSVDDTTLQQDINSSTNHTYVINFDFGQNKTWTISNKLSLSVEITNYMRITKRSSIENINISLSGQPIARTSHHKFLGVFLDNKMKFDKHINKLLCSKETQTIRVMRRISHLVPMDV